MLNVAPQKERIPDHLRAMAEQDDKPAASGKTGGDMDDTHHTGFNPGDFVIVMRMTSYRKWGVACLAGRPACEERGWKS